MNRVPDAPEPVGHRQRWINRTVIGIVAATLFSDFSHEMCTAILPLYLTSIGLGAAALGVIEGVADFLVSLSKLGGGVLGHHLRYKRPWASVGYLMTALATAGMGLVRGLTALVSLRSIAWIARGYRGPLRDDMLADAVEKTHFGRAYGLERAGDMLGAVAGPLVATLLVWLGFEFRTIILWTAVPGVVAAGAMYFLVRERPPRAGISSQPAAKDNSARGRPKFPPAFRLVLIGVFVFGLGDFSRTFLILLAAGGLGESGSHAAGTLSVAVLLYALHNFVSATAAYPIGRLGDRRPRLSVLTAGYALGAGTNLLLAFSNNSLGLLVPAILLSAVYIAVEETMEKAAVAEILPRELRSLGFGILAGTNAVGDMISSLYVGFLLDAGRPHLAFGIPTAFGTAGTAWLLWLKSRPMARPGSA